MYADRFEMCVAKVRHRFATALESKIKSTIVSTDHMTRNEDRAINSITESYRRLHSIYGVGATVGFVATGEAAHDAEATLVDAYLEKRSLTEHEFTNLRNALARLQDAATSELRVMYERGR
ncbi:MAG TPA: Hpt domain-containing protein [Bradyrhizobium sp.]